LGVASNIGCGSGWLTPGEGLADGMVSASMCIGSDAKASLIKALLTGPSKFTRIDLTDQ